MNLIFSKLIAYISIIHFISVPKVWESKTPTDLLYFASFSSPKFPNVYDNSKFSSFNVKTWFGKDTQSENFSDAWKASEVKIKPNVLQKLKQLSSNALSMKMLLNWYFPHSLNLKEPNLKRNTYQDLLKEINSLDQLFNNSIKIALNEDLKWAQESKTFNITEALNSPLINPSIIKTLPSPFFEDIPWDPLGLQNPNGTEFINLFKSIMTNFQNNKKNLYQFPSELYNHLPNSIRSELLLARNKTISQWLNIKRIKNPLEAIKELTRALFEFDKYYKNLIVESQKITAYYSPKTFDKLDLSSRMYVELCQSTLGIAQIAPTHLKEAGRLEFVTDLPSEDYISYSKILSKMSSKVNSLEEMKRMMRTNEWLKNTNFAKINEKLAGFYYEDFDQTLASSNILLNLKPRQIIKGKIAQIHKNFILVDINAKSLAYLSSREITPHNFQSNLNLNKIFKLGETYYFEILSLNQDEIHLTLRTIQEFSSWNNLLKLYEHEQTFHCKVISTNSKGAIIKYNNVKGFLPFAQISDQFDLSNLPGTDIPCKILFIDISRNKLILSNKQADPTYNKYKISELVHGIVIDSTEFGIMIKLSNNTTGLLKVDQVDSENILRIRNTFYPGSPFKGFLIDYDKVSGIPLLSLKGFEDKKGTYYESKGKIPRQLLTIHKNSDYKKIAAKIKQKEMAQSLFKSLGIKRNNLTNQGKKTDSFLINSTFKGFKQKYKGTNNLLIRNLLWNKGQEPLH